MSSRDYRYDFEEEIARDEYIQETLKGISEDGVRGYLGVYGDAVEERIHSSLIQAEQLKGSGWCDSAVTMAVTAIELTIRFLLVRPLIQAAFLSEDWADLLTQRIASGRTIDDRKLLPEILRFHDLDIKQITLDDGRELWQAILDIYKVRDKVVHAGEPSTIAHAEIAIACATKLREAVVVPIAEKLGFSLEKTGKWQNIEKENFKSHYSPQSPFK